jgi:hypothetical protein
MKRKAGHTGATLTKTDARGFADFERSRTE